MTRIAYVINYIAKNGPSSVVLNIIRNLDMSEFEVSLITLFRENDQAIVDELRKQNINVLECKTMRRNTCLIGKNRELKQYILQGEYDVIHTHGFVPDILLSQMSLQAYRISTIHNNMFEDYPITYGALNGAVMTQMQMAALRKQDTCVCCSQSVYNVMKRHLSNLICIPNGIDHLKSSTSITRYELGIPETSRVFIYTGVLSKGKRVQQLIRYFVAERTDEEYLLIAGTGPENEACQQVADNHVLLLGGRQDINALMAISDIYTSASFTEGFSIAVLEALSHGLTLLLSDMPSHREVFAKASMPIGELFSAETYGQALQRLRQGMGKCSKEQIKDIQRDVFSGKNMAAQYVQLYCKRVEIH